MRKFTDGRQNEVLMNPKHYSIYKIMENFLTRPDNIERGPVSLEDYEDIQNGALWLDKYSNFNSADLKYYENGFWKLLFGDKFQMIINILSPTEPENPVEGQLWINPSGILMYYKNGQFIPIKAVLSDVEESNSYQYEDFLIISPLHQAPQAVLSNVSKFIFTNTPIEKWESGRLYYYQQGALDDNDNLYVCMQQHYSTEHSELYDPNYWLRVDTLLQYLVPNTNYDKFFADEYFLHEKEMPEGNALLNTEFSMLGATLSTEDKDIVHEFLQAYVIGDNGYYDCLMADTINNGSNNNQNTPDIPSYNENDEFMPVATMSYESDDIIHWPLSFDIEGDGFYVEGVYYSYNDYITVLETPAITDGNQLTEKIIINTDDCYEEKNEIEDDPYEEKGYIPNTNVSIYIPENDVLRSIEDDHIPEFDFSYNENKYISAVHVNPVRLNKVDKYLISLDSNIIQVPAECTEFYLVKDGYGKLLTENSEDGQVFDYVKRVVNGNTYIKISDKIMDKIEKANLNNISNSTYEGYYIYAIHYDFSNNVKKSGKLYRKKVFVNNPGRIYIGPQNMNNICVFAQGIYYYKDKYTYEYDYNTGYLQFKYKLLGSTDSTADLAIIKFPDVFTGTITSTNYRDNNYIENRGYKIDLNQIIINPDHCIAFISGIETKMNNDFTFYPDDNTSVYFPGLTREYVETHGGTIKWTVIGTDVIKNGQVTFEMYRGITHAIETSSGSSTGDRSVIIPISRDINDIHDGELFLDTLETPILFVDGLLIDQADIRIYENCLTVENLRAGQEVLMLADTNSNLTLDDLLLRSEIYPNNRIDPKYAIEEERTRRKILEDGTTDSYVYEDLIYQHDIYDYNKLIENYSDSIIYQETISNLSIKVEKCDTILLYFEKGLKVDSEAVIQNTYPIQPINNQIIHIVNNTEDKWMKYSKAADMWSEIPKFTLNRFGIEIPNKQYTDLVNTIGYTLYPKQVSILNGIQNQKYCTYYAYVYSDTVEKKLLTGYCIPNGIIGNNESYNEFKLEVKHFYLPARNELSVYLNGIKQNLDTFQSDNFEESLTKECSVNNTDGFTLCIDNGTKEGKPIDRYEGYFTYSIHNMNSEYKKYCHDKLSDDDIKELNEQGYEVDLLSEPNENIIFYVIEPCETGEEMACEKTILTYKNSLSSKGAFANNTYYDRNMNLCKGNVRVFVNGLRQPYGSFKDSNNNDIICYSIVDSHTIKFNDMLIGGSTSNLGSMDDPKFPINTLQPNRNHEVLDEIIVETRTDLNLRELTIPIRKGQVEFTEADGLPMDLFKTKDFIMIYINGRAYGNNYSNNGKIITLNDLTLDDAYRFNQEDNFITFEWR